MNGTTAAASLYVYLYIYKCTCRRTAGNIIRPWLRPFRPHHRWSKSSAVTTKKTTLPRAHCRRFTVTSIRNLRGNLPPDIPMGFRCSAVCCVGGSPGSVKNRWSKKVRFTYTYICKIIFNWWSILSWSCRKCNNKSLC